MAQEPREWLIRKGGYFYRPERAGYTSDVIEAGLYTENEARNEARIEPHNISAHHASEYARQINKARTNVARFAFIEGRRGNA